VAFGERPPAGGEDGGRAWRPPAFSGFLRGEPQPPESVERWERLLDAERTVPYMLALAAARRPWLGRLLGLPGGADAPALTLAERERRVAAVGRAPLVQIAYRLAGRRRPRSPGARSLPANWPGGPPAPGPLVDREIDRALAFLGTMAFEELQRRGWHLQPKHFYWPLNDLELLRARPRHWSRSALPRGVYWDVAGQEALAAELAAYGPELAGVPATGPPDAGEFFWDNGLFGGLDAYAYYGLVRRLRPRRVVEVGSGFSSLVLKRALAANGEDAAVTLIEPYPRRDLLARLPAGWELVEKPVQEAGLGAFEELGAGDVLFYDGSHCVRTGGDVNWVFFEVLPRLAPGVWVHVHDIWFPGDYPADWIFDEGFSWNEQYLLQAFLMYNDSFRVRLGVRLLAHERPELVARLFPIDPVGASVWLERTA